MRKLCYSLSLALCMYVLPLQAKVLDVTVKQADIHEGCIAEKIWLQGYALPVVKINNVQYAACDRKAAVNLSSPDKLDIRLGMERQQPFAIVRVPAYSLGQDGEARQVASFSLDITEQPANSSARVASFNDASTSVLSQGTWYKIGVTKTGFYKIDYNFLVSMGLKPSSINPADIRVFGNGGNMLSQDNSVPRPADLLENGVLVNDNGNGQFDNGESVVFYGVGPTAWFKDSTDQRFYHQNNLYTDTAFYFVTFDQGAALQVGAQASVPTANTTVSSFNYYDAHDSELVNPVNLGKNWYGERFYPALGTTSQSFVFNTGPLVSCAYATVEMAGTTPNSAGNAFTVSLNGTAVGTTALGQTSGDSIMSVADLSGQGACGASSVTVNVNFVSAPDGSGVGYLHYIELNARRSLVMTDDQMSFRDWASVGAGNVANYQLQGANSSTVVWDITNPQVPVRMSGTLSGGTYSFSQDASMLHEFAAMNDLNLYSPLYAGPVANQNLHGLPQVDLIIVAHPDFWAQAQQLSTYHQTHDNLRVAVVTPQQIYNEFSSGGQDISAIRDFARMFYKRANGNTAQMPSNILLFGGASYDYKDRVANNSNFIPVFESACSTNDITSFSTDDFFGFLDDNENIEDYSIYNTLDIGVGRLPARSVDDATAMVNKIISYTQPATLGPWRTASTFVACINDDAGYHMYDAEYMASTVKGATSNLMNEDKVYEDAIPLVSTPAGARCPNANAEIDNDVYKGVFMINYNGHGNTQVWSSERILTQADYDNWNNSNMLPFMITATCDFGQFDQPQTVSSASQLIVRSGGGVIAVLTTTEAVYAIYNVELNSQYLSAQCTRNADGTWNSFGAACRIGKNITYAAYTDPGTIQNFRKFSLLGDPALTPTFPNYQIQLDSAIDGATMLRADTVKALGKYYLEGSVRDLSGNLLPSFNGEVSLTFYDKPIKVLTITNTGYSDSSFYLQNSIVYKGRATVTNGKFSVEFIAPLDINYYAGAGKVSTYADNGVTDAAGADTSLAVGGYSDNPVLSNNAPVVKAYINDSLFLNGGITGPNTSLFVSIYSLTGINVTGNEVGHDLTAVIDGQRETPYILNDYYETAPNTYQRGYVNFPLSGLAPGKHSIVVSAWDVNNNEGFGEVDFTVIDSNVMAIQQLSNYPNPFTNTTNFVFEHNQPGVPLKVSIEIYSTSGQRVTNISETFTPSDSRTSEITWDGTDDHGVRLPSGVYIYRLNLTTAEGFKSSAYQKLVIVR